MASALLQWPEVPKITLTVRPFPTSLEAATKMSCGAQFGIEDALRPGLRPVFEAKPVLQEIVVHRYPADTLVFKRPTDLGVDEADASGLDPQRSAVAIAA